MTRLVEAVRALVGTGEHREAMGRHVRLLDALRDALVEHDGLRPAEATLCTGTDCYCDDLKPGENCRNWAAVEQRRLEAQSPETVEAVRVERARWVAQLHEANRIIEKLRAELGRPEATPDTTPIEGEPAFLQFDRIKVALGLDLFHGPQDILEEISEGRQALHDLAAKLGCKDHEPADGSLASDIECVRQLALGRSEATPPSCTCAVREPLDGIHEQGCPAEAHQDRIAALRNLCDNIEERAEKAESLYRDATRQLAAIADALGNTNGDPEVSLGIVREIAHGPRFVDLHRIASRVAKAWEDDPTSIHTESAVRSLEHELGRDGAPLRRYDGPACETCGSDAPPIPGTAAYQRRAAAQPDLVGALSATLDGTGDAYEDAARVCEAMAANWEKSKGVPLVSQNLRLAAEQIRGRTR